MKKQILSIGKSLTIKEQKEVFGGNSGFWGSNACHSKTTQSECTNGTGCQWYGNYCDGNVPHIVIVP